MHAAITRKLGGDRRPFRIYRTSAGAIIVSDPTRGLHATLSAGRIAVRGAHGVRVTLSAPAIGRGATLTPVRGFAAPALSKHRVTFSSPGFDEWYARGSSGVEQAFAIANRPAGGGPLEISQTLSGNATAHLQNGGQGVRFGSGPHALRYVQLFVTDAADARIPASMSLSDHRLTITITDTNAAYPLRVDPIVAGGLCLVLCSNGNG